MAILIAALAAEGTSEIGDIHQIDRGYEQIDQRLPRPRRPDRARPCATDESAAPAVAFVRSAA